MTPDAGTEHLVWARAVREFMLAPEGERTVSVRDGVLRMKKGAPPVAVEFEFVDAEGRIASRGHQFDATSGRPAHFPAQLPFIPERGCMAYETWHPRRVWLASWEGEADIAEHVVRQSESEGWTEQEKSAFKSPVLRVRVFQLGPLTRHVYSTKIPFGPLILTVIDA